jgi:hypothetical protein
MSRSVAHGFQVLGRCFFVKTGQNLAHALHARIKMVCARQRPHCGQSGAVKSEREIVERALVNIYRYISEQIKLSGILSNVYRLRSGQRNAHLFSRVNVLSAS